MYIYNNISLNSSQNEKCFIQNSREIQNILFSNKFFFLKILLFVR